MKVNFLILSVAIVSLVVGKSGREPKDLERSALPGDLDAEIDEMPQATNDIIPAPMPQIEPDEEAEDEPEEFFGIVPDENLYDMPSATNDVEPLPMPELNKDEESIQWL